MNYDQMICQIKEKTGANFKYAMQSPGVKQELDYVKWAESKGIAQPHTYDYAMTVIGREIELTLTPATVEVGDGVTVCLYTDQHAATVIRKTDCTLTVQYDKAILDPNFKPEWIPGGFSAHCVNQEDQTYTYERDPNGRIEKYRWSNKFGSYGTPGNLRLIKGRHEFYDFNF